MSIITQMNVSSTMHDIADGHNIAPVFNDQTSYNAGDFVLYGGQLYYAKDGTGPGWAASSWNTSTVTEYYNGRIASTDASLSALSSTVGSLNTELTSVNARVTTLYGNLGQTNLNVTSLDNKIYSTDANVAAVNTRVTGINSALLSTISNTNGNVSTLSNTVSGLSTTVGSLSTTVDSHTSDLRNTVTNITSLSTRVTSLTSTVGTHTTDIANCTANISDQRDIVVSLTSTVGNHSVNIASLQTSINSLNSSVTTHTSNITSLTTNVSSLQTTAGTLQTDLTSTQATVANHSTELSNIISAFNASTSYQVNDYCINNNKVYRCINATSGEWNASTWTETVLCNDITGIKNQAATTSVNLLNLQSVVSGKENTSNKVTTISSSSTDTQYPSAKATYDAIEEATEAPIIANAYSAASTYAVGDICIYSAKLYKCVTAITTAEAWTAAHWSEIVVGDELEKNSKDLNEFYFKTYYPALYKPYLATLSDCYVNRNTGQLITGQSGWTTVYQQALDSAQTHISFSGLWNIAFYDSSKGYISGLSGAGQTSGTDIPSGAAYITYSWLTAVAIWVCYGDTTSNAYTLIHTTLEDKVDQLDGKKPNADEVGFLKLGTNLFNKNLETQDKYLSGSGTLTDFSGYCVSDYIPVTASTSYICNQNIPRYALYDSDKTFLSLGASNKVAIVPSSSGYIRISYYSPSSDKSVSNLLVFMAGTTVPTEYASYCYYPNSTTTYPVDFNATYWKDKTICTFGDSNTQNQRWQKYMNAKLSCTHQNCGIGGTSMAGSNSNAMWQDVRVNAIDTTSSAVIIMAGTNDAASSRAIGTYSLSNTDTDTFVGAYNTCLTKIYTRMGVTCPIFIMTPLPCFDTTTYPYVKEISEAVRKIGAMWSLPVIEAQDEVGINTQNYLTVMGTDGVHINYDGGKLLASLVVGVMKAHEPIVSDD